MIDFFLIIFKKNYLTPNKSEKRKIKNHLQMFEISTCLRTQIENFPPIYKKKRLKFKKKIQRKKICYKSE